MTTSPTSLVGAVLNDRYIVTDRIARGGMATVFLATDNRLEREVAVKVMHPHLADDVQFVARFHREAKSAARMSHPNVVAVFDQGKQDDLVYLVMEYVPGTTLRDLLLQRGALTAGEALEVIEPVLDALSAAHRAGLIHRDIKPENILITEDGRVKVADFGLARAASTSHSSATTGMLMGTAAYLSPELVTRGVADARSDVYAVGIMAFEMLTGRQPFTGDGPLQVAFKHVNDEVPAPSSIDPGLPRALDEIVTWSTGRDPDQRPRDARELLAQVRQARASLSDAELDRPPSAPPIPIEEIAPAGPTPTQQHPTTPVTTGDPSAPLANLVQAVEAESRSEPQALYDDTPADGVSGVFASTADLEEVPAPPRPGRTQAIANHPPRKAPRPTGRSLTVLVGLLVTALILAGIGWYFTAGPGAFTTTPQVSGSSEQARQSLTEAGLTMNELPEYNETVAAGQVIRTSPEAGQDVRKGGEVDVFVSRGSQYTQAPDLVSKDPADAEAELRSAGLALAPEREEIYSSGVEKGMIATQTPPAGEQIKLGESVTVQISKGPEPVAVPGVVGLSAADAQSRISGRGLRYSTQSVASDLPAGVVVGQSPAAGSSRLPGTTVTISVSQGPPPPPTPAPVPAPVPAPIPGQ